MKLSLLRYFAWISLLVLASVSCRSSRLRVSGEQACRIHDSIIDGSFNKAKFKARTIYQDKELSGLILIKNTHDGKCKIAFYNELGLTYLEGILEYSSKHKKLVVKNIAPIINHRFFAKNFEKSIQFIFTDNVNQRNHTSMPPGSPASLNPEKEENKLLIELRNGYILELKPNDQ